MSDGVGGGGGRGGVEPEEAAEEVEGAEDGGEQQEGDHDVAAAENEGGAFDSFLDELGAKELFEVEHEGADYAVCPAHLLAEEVVGGVGHFAANAEFTEVGDAFAGGDEAEGVVDIFGQCSFGPAAEFEEVFFAD